MGCSCLLREISVFAIWNYLLMFAENLGNFNIMFVVLMHTAVSIVLLLLLIWGYMFT